MRITHRVPRQAWDNRRPPEPDPDYDAEVTATLARARRAWDKAQKALARAERALTHSRATAEAIARRDQLRREVLARLDELRTLEEQMQQRPVTGPGRGRVANPLRRAASPYFRPAVKPAR